MIIAVTTEGNTIFQHFGQCKTFTLYEVEAGKVKSKAVLDTSESGHSALVNVLQNKDVDVVLCGGIGGGAKTGLAGAGIQVVPALTGNIDDLVQKYINGESMGNVDYECNHKHGEGEHHSHECNCHH